MGLTIRDAQAADAERISSLLTQLGYPTQPSAVEARLERLAVVGDRVLVADLDGRAVGLGHLQVAPAIERERPAAKIGALVVDEGHRGQGVGRALMQALEDEARLRGCELLFLTTAERRDDAHAFYEHVGLELTGRRYGRTLSE
ncbi:MAG TPA: GNAT family N-acetyltransferase [Gaiellaceae bacterium]|jgi:GNAT superfamily N-acetyltransferase|nr:GNAT family N-acetyltransferase [Gaiellaceae bacterium]